MFVILIANVIFSEFLDVAFLGEQHALIGSHMIVVIIYQTGNEMLNYVRVF